MSTTPPSGSRSSSVTDEVAEPLLRVVRGEPTDDELAALVTVVAALGAARYPEAPQGVRLWGSPRQRLRRPMHPGRLAWRASGLPR